MKRLFLTGALIAIAVNLLCQAPQGFNYQAILRNSDGTVKANETVSLQISLIDDNGSSAYMEIHNTQTNQLGLVNVTIGQGTTTDDLSEVDWSTGPYFIDIMINGEHMGSSPLLSVPYALYAETASTFTETDPAFSGWDKSSGISITENQITDIGSYIDTETQSLADVAELNNSVNSQIKNLTDPTEDQDAVTKAYVDVLKAQIEELQLETGLRIIDIDGNIYNTVKIGDQVWMAENLKVTNYFDGTTLPLVESGAAWVALGLTDKAYCWFDNNSSNGDTYGALYTWAAAMNGAGTSDTNPSGVQGVCPDDWHLPSDSEWEQLAQYISDQNGGYSKSRDNRWENVGKHLKTTSGWDSGGNGTDDYGFSGLPGGYRHFDGNFFGLNLYGSWWSSTAVYSSTMAEVRKLHSDNSIFDRNNLNIRDGFSIRCVKD